MVHTGTHAQSGPGVVVVARSGCAETQTAERSSAARRSPDDNALPMLLFGETRIRPLSPWNPTCKGHVTRPEVFLE